MIVPINFNDLTEKDKKEALEAVNLIAEKRCGTIKGRTCANGAKQRKYVSKMESFSSPTAALESIITTLMIDVYEGRDIAIADVSGTYLHAEFPSSKRVILKLTGVSVDIMCKVNPEYRQHEIYEIKNGKRVKVLYVRVLRALYGCFESALLWYRFYSSLLEKLGFKINPYNKCVANKEINGKQCTIVFYVDDNKISHEDPEVVTSVLKQISGHFGELKVSRGKKHDYLGMDIEVKDNKVYIGMKGQIDEVLSWGAKQNGRLPATPSTTNLITISNKSTQLKKDDADLFHSIVQKLMHICKRARPDLEPALSYLSTRVSCPLISDQEKLQRLLDFVRATEDDRRIVGAQSLEEMFTWIDASYTVHPNMKSHTGVAISFGKGVIHAKSSKQKINTKSLTEAELVGVSEYLPYHIWVENFLKHQGYKLRKKLLYQDNESAIKMEVNGRNSCTGNSRHVDIRYFFVHDRVKSGSIKVVYCPTEKMLANFFIKPLQGGLFKKFRNAVMGYNMTDDIIREKNEEECSYYYLFCFKTMMTSFSYFISDVHQKSNYEDNELHVIHLQDSSVPVGITNLFYITSTRCCCVVPTARARHATS